MLIYVNLFYLIADEDMDMNTLTGVVKMLKGEQKIAM